MGGNFGGGWTNGNLNIPGNNFYGGISELIGGVQAGYNVQAGSFLFGVEGDFDWASLDHPLLPAPTLGSVSQHWISTVAGRVGIVKDRWLVFGKLGGGWVHSTALLNLPGGSWNGSNTDAGVLIGGGLEYGFKAHWTLKLEYDYLTQSTWMSTTALPVSLSRDVQTIKAGINYKFVSGVSEASEVSKYAHEPSKPKTWRRDQEPDRRHGQRAVPEQHQFQHRTVQSRAGSAQHPAGRAAALDRRLDRDLPHDCAADKPTPSAVRQQHQWRRRHYPIVVSDTRAAGVH